MIQITYIFHDCFVAELADSILIFDFWKDPDSKKGIPSFILNADKNKSVYVFVSHHHKDHYTKRIFKWQRMIPGIKYIISKDVATFARHIFNQSSTYQGDKPSHDSVILMKVGEVYEDNNIRVEAFGSTDIGNSYYIETVSADRKKVSFFHSGDLNAWIWKDESTQEEVEKSLNDFMTILNEISTLHKSIDYVMFPVDSRIGTDYFTGARLFVNAIDVKHFFPMHFELGESDEERRQRARDAANVKLYANQERGEYICLMTPYSCFVKN